MKIHQIKIISQKDTVLIILQRKIILKECNKITYRHFQMMEDQLALD
jgi:hypothetical protein